MKSVSLAESVNLPANRIANKAEVAEFFGVSIVTIGNWVSRGCPYIQRGGRGIGWELDLLAVASWRFGSDAPSGDDPDNLTPKERLDYYKGSREKRLNEIEDGTVVYADDARKAMAKSLKATMLMLTTLLDNVERSAKLTPEQAELIEKAIDAERENLYRALIEESLSSVGDLDEDADG